MQATLIYNRNAGGLNGITPDDLTDALRDAGYSPVYQSTSSEKDLDPILADIEDGLVVSAGGDGTLRAVATRLIEKENVAISVIPLGTANNIAKLLGIEGSPLEIVDDLKQPRKCSFDVGCVSSPWGQDFFLEGAGYGFYADVLATYDPDEGKSIFRSVEAITETLADYECTPARIKLDGQDISGAYLMMAALNSDSIGPRLKLAPDADPKDGKFDVVCISEKERDGLLRYLVGLVTEEFDELPSVDLFRGRKLEIEWTGFNLHVDAEVRPDLSERPPERDPAKGARPTVQESTNATIHMEVLPQALEFWIPPDE